MADIKMPATPRSAYDPKRPPNALLLNHVRELERAVSQAGRRVKRQKPKTEAQVAAYMRHLNRALHQQILVPKTMKRRPLNVPLDPRRTRRRAKSRPARRKRKAAAPRRKKALRSSRSRRSGRS